MTDRHLILGCALGAVFIDKENSEYFLVIENEEYITSNKLPGDKFTAKTFLEEYLFIYATLPIFLRQKTATKTRRDIGTWHFTPEAVEKARAALESWK